MSGWKSPGDEPGKKRYKNNGESEDRGSNVRGFEERGNSDFQDIAATSIYARHQSEQKYLPAVLKQRSYLLRLRLEGYLAQTIFSLTHSLFREREAGTYFHFAPLIFGIATAIYFWAPSEPVMFVALSCCMILAISATRLQNHGKIWLMLCALALFFGGLSAGKIRTSLLDTNALTHQITGQVSGTVIEVSQNQRGAPRYLIVPHSIEGVSKSGLPTYIRLSSASKHQQVFPGEYISGLARLRAISGPAYPGSFDFSFNSWFNGLGASGFFMGKPTISPANSPPIALSHRLQITINQLRVAIAGRIRAALKGESGDVAVALIIGDRTGIDKITRQSLRQSGLAHVLAISGMHMALVSLTMVWCVRFVLAFNSNLAVSRPIKNWASLAGFITASSYLAISGMAVATQRAWIMISIVMFAAMIMRKSITLRGVAIAALAILILQPESILSPGFQMSFAAVAAIVAAYEWLDGRKTKWRFGSNRVFRFFATLMFTSLIAGLATSLFAAYHFHRIAPMGVVTNLLAMPLVSVIIMPMALAAMLLMPFGLEHLALIPMGAGIEQVISISNYVNARSFNGVTGQLGASVLPLSFAGLFLLTMLKTRLRLIGLMVLMISAYFWRSPPIPDILLSEDGRAIAIRNNKNQLAMLYPRRNKFVRDIWLRAFSEDKSGSPPLPPDKRPEVVLIGATSNRNPLPNAKEPFGLLKPTCDKDHCVAYTRQGALVFVVYAPRLLQYACNTADILLAPKLRWVNCNNRQPALVIKRGQMEEYGAHAIYIKTTTQAPKFSKSATAGEMINQQEHSGSNARRQVFSSPKTGSLTQNKPDDRSGTISTTASTSPAIPRQVVQIFKVDTAIRSTARPWNKHRAGRAAYRQDQ